jgi:hypothetical protein
MKKKQTVKIDECYCGHPKSEHTGGLGMCTAYQFGYFCKCSRFKRVKGEIDPEFQAWKKAMKGD